MSILIDRLIQQSKKVQSEELPGRWFIAKPVFIKRSFFYRLKEAWRVLIGNHVYTYHYKKDETEGNP